MKLFALPLGLFLFGCAGLFPAEDADSATAVAGDGDGNDADDDGDGLTNAEEDELGTDPDESDSDGDGIGDEEEIDENTDPLDEDDFPYEGGWAKGACRDDVDSDGYSEGDVSKGWTMPDQFGEDVSLHDFCDRTIYMVFAAFW